MIKNLTYFLTKAAKHARIRDRAIEHAKTGEWKQFGRCEHSMVWVRFSDEKLIFVDVTDEAPEWPVSQLNKYGFIGIVTGNEFVPLEEE